jgi:hypothetical protein
MFEVGWVPDTSLNPESDSESLPHYDAELRFWTTFEQHGFVLAAGKIFGDRKGRWPDGHMIQTSPLQTPSAAKDGRIIATLNSHYLLVGPKRLLIELMAEKER